MVYCRLPSTHYLPFIICLVVSFPCFSSLYQAISVSTLNVIGVLLLDFLFCSFRVPVTKVSYLVQVVLDLMIGNKTVDE